MLKKILFKNSSTFQFLFATIGAFIGLTALLLSVQLILDVKSFHSNEEELFGPNSVVIQKRVTKLSTIGLNSTAFTKKDIADLYKKPFITDVAPFQSADFKVGISEIEGDGLPHFYADMFFQAIPNRFMDIDVDWDWNEDSEFIPIVLPRDFIMIINYGFAQSQGLSQISEDLLMQARLKIHLEGNGQKKEMIGKVVGFSHKISSILVPESFLSQANEKYGKGVNLDPNRIFITTKDNSYGELDQLMNKMNLDVSESAIDVAKIKTIIAVVIGIFGIASVLIMLLSLMGFVQYSQLVLSRAAYEIQTLLRIGYSIEQIVKTFIRQLSVIFGIITFSAIAIMVLIKLFIVDIWLTNNGITIAGTSIFITLMVAIFCFLLFIISNYLNIKKTVNKLGAAE